MECQIIIFYTDSDDYIISLYNLDLLIIKVFDKRFDSLNAVNNFLLKERVQKYNIVKYFTSDEYLKLKEDCMKFHIKIPKRSVL